MFSTLVATMLVFWFPGELFLLDGGWQGLKLVAMVDLVLGPALTLLLYKPGKPKLVLDMSMIAAFQIAALAYGFYATYQQRTVALVYAENMFNTLSASTHRLANDELRQLELEPRQVQDIANGRPALVYSDYPRPGELGEYIASLLNNYPESHERSDRYIPIDGKLDTLAQSSVDDEAIAAFPDPIQEAIAASRAAHGGETLALHRFKAAYGQGVALFDPVSRTIVDYIDVPPVAADAVAEQSE